MSFSMLLLLWMLRSCSLAISCMYVESIRALTAIFFGCQRIVIVFMVKICRVLQVDLENVSLHIFIHLCENIKVINLPLVQKSKFALWKWFAHGISVKIVTVKVHDVVVWFVFVISLVEIRDVCFGVAIADHAYASTHSSFGEQIFVWGAEKIEGNSGHFEARIETETGTRVVVERI